LLKEYLKDEGKTMDDMEEWNVLELFTNMAPMTIMMFKMYESEGFIGNCGEYLDVINEKFKIMGKITVKLLEQLMQFESTIHEYFDDPDDPPVPRIEKTYQFIEFDKYMTYKGLIKFDLDYVIERTKIMKMIWVMNYTQKAIEETPENSDE
jgi:RNA binding exosome subunit